MQCTDPPTYAAGPIDLILFGRSHVCCPALSAYSQLISACRLCSLISLCVTHTNACHLCSNLLAGMWSHALVL